ncbi:hypothetical protein [Sphingomonas sp. ACRSK]|uniref:hypothetical protein n=1 Tax=Sphingomonas sp. ACRSK TaxID=2918213 RepID=UPI001EF5C62F|nr:hypothetical protein [Sphingomonas sp. ACRSK]MCG7350014.1 hypothetical protein [Sphingomonas sp. ACRSK]
MTFRLTPAMSAALRTGRYPFAPLVRVALPSYTLCHLVGSAEVRFLGEKFVGRDPRFGILAAASNLKDGVSDEAPDWSLTFIPPNDAVASELADATAQGGEVGGWLGLIDPATGRLLPEPIQLFAGELDVPRIRVGKGTRSLEWRCVSALEPFHDEEKGARLSDSWHQLVWPGETGCANMTGIDKTSNWGVERPPSAVRTTGGSLNPSFLGNMAL